MAGIFGLGWSYFTRSWPVAEYFPAVFLRPANATVLATRIGTPPDGDEQGFLPEVLLQFDVAGQQATIWTPAGEAAADRDAAETARQAFAKGQKLTCWYDPLDPSATTLEPAAVWGLWLTGGLLLALALAGAYGVISGALQVGASAERRAALAKAASVRLAGGEDDLPTARDFPTVPRDANLLNSPGVKLKYRLPASQEPAWRLFASAVWMLTCATLAVALAVVAAEEIFSGRSAWLLGGFVVCVAALATWTAYNFLNELVAASWMGPTSVEIAQLPLFPGETCDVYLNQAGNLQVSLLRMLLICDEETTFLQGTDVRRDCQRVHSTEIYRREKFAVDASQPIEEHCPLRIPPQAMHSFKSQHNAVAWKLVVEIEAENWPTYLRTFPLIVYPARPREPTREDSA